MSIDPSTELHKSSTGIGLKTHDSSEEDPANFIKQELDNLKGAELKEIVSLIKEGAKFTVFYYRVSYLAVSYEKISPAILIRNPTEFNFYRKKYNRMALIKGAFFFPFGPLVALSQIKKNNKGALDVTGDILLNLTEEDVKQNVVIMREMYTLFSGVGKSELKYFNKILLKYANNHLEIDAIYVALFINVEQGVEPPFCVGVSVSDSSTIDFESIEKALYKDFRSFNEFVFFDLNATGEELDINNKLKSQGQCIFTR